MGQIAVLRQSGRLLERLDGLSFVAEHELERPHALVRSAQLWILLQGAFDQRTCLLGVIPPSQELAADGRALRQRERPRRQALLLDANLSSDFHERELPDVRLEGLLESLHVAEGAPRGLDFLDVLREQPQEIGELFPLGAVVGDHQVVGQGSRLRIEDRYAVGLVVMGRSVIHGEERFQRQQLHVSEKPDMPWMDAAEANLLFADDRAGVELRQSLVQPKREPEVVHPAHEVRVFVIDDVVRFISHVRAQRHVMPVRPVEEDPRWPSTALLGPELGQQRLQALFVPGRQDHDRAGGVRPKRQQLAEQAADLLELPRDLPCAALARIAHDHEMSAPCLDPRIRGFRACPDERRECERSRHERPGSIRKHHGRAGGAGS